MLTWQALAAMGEDESESDDDENQRKEYEEPPINYRKEIKELCFHSAQLAMARPRPWPL